MMHAQGNASSESVFGPYSAIPPEVLAKRYPPVPYRPPARPVYMASPPAIAALRDRSLGDFDPAFADALEAAVQGSIPINGSYEQDGRAKRTTENLVQDFSRRPPPNHMPPLAANYQLQHIARGASSSPIPSFPARLLKDYRTSIVATSEAEIKAAQKAELYSAASSSSPVPAFSLPASSPAPEPSGVTLPPSIEDSLPRGADESKEDFDKRRNRERSRKSRSIRAAGLKAAVSTETPTIASQTPTRAPLATPRESNLYWHLDFGHRGSSGPSALDIILEWMGTEGNLLTYRTSSVAARRELLEPVAESLAEQGMVARPMKKIISKVGEIYKKCCKVADEVRNQTGYGVPNDDPEGESAESMAVTVEQHLQSSQDGRIYLQLSKVLRDRHGFNPLKLQDSSMASGTERQEIMMTLFGGGDMPKNDDDNEEDDDDLSDTEREGDEEAIQTPMGPTVAKGKATVATSGNDSLSKKRTGPAARNSSTGPAFAPSVVPAASAESRERKTKGSSRDEIGKVVSESLKVNIEFMKVRGQKQDERYQRRQQQQEEDRRALERLEAARVQEAQNLAHQQAARAREAQDLARDKATRAQETHRVNAQRQEQMHQVALIERFVAMCERGLDPDAVGRVVFGKEKWDEVGSMLLAMIRRDVPEKKLDARG